jgi:hypothetical protein
MTIEAGERCSVHYNLRRGDYVLAAKPKGKVDGYAPAVLLRGVTFKVSEASRQACIRAGQRQVHAWALGTLVATLTATDAPDPRSGAIRCTFNPFRGPTFVRCDSGEAVDGWDGHVLFAGAYCYLLRGE